MIFKKWIWCFEYVKNFTNIFGGAFIDKDFYLLVAKRQTNSDSKNDFPNNRRESD